MASGADRISDLPEGVLHHILSLLPAQDAVRTCVLAQSWRNRWRYTPALRLACSTGGDDSVNAFGRFVDNLLRVRRGGPPLHSCDFDLDVDLDSCDFTLYRHGGRWIRSVLDLKVRELGFRLFQSKYYHQSVLNDWLSSQHLTSLELTGVNDDCGVLDFSECPALESLNIEKSWMSAEMRSPSLKNLCVRKCFFLSEERTWMSFPSLVSFEFINNSGRAPMLNRMPHLEVAKVQFDLDNDCNDVCKNGRLDDCGDAACVGCSDYYDPDDSGSVFLHGLAEATYLNLSAYPRMYVFSRDLKWCPAFNKLRTLVLSKWFLSTDLSALIWFLHHTPLLENLTLEIPKVMILCALVSTPCKSEKYQTVDDPSRLLKQSDIKTANMVYNSVIVSASPYSRSQSHCNWSDRPLCCSTFMTARRQ